MRLRWIPVLCFAGSAACFIVLFGISIGQRMLPDTLQSLSLTGTHAYADLRGTAIPGGICLYSDAHAEAWCQFVNSQGKLIILSHAEPSCMHDKAGTLRYCVEHDALGRWLVVSGTEKEH